MWKFILRAAIVLGLDKWAKAKAAALVKKIAAKAEKKAKDIAESVKKKVVEEVTEDGKWVIVTDENGKRSVRPV